MNFVRTKVTMPSFMINFYRLDLHHKLVMQLQLYDEASIDIGLRKHTSVDLVMIIGNACLLNSYVEYTCSPNHASLIRGNSFIKFEDMVQPFPNTCLLRCLFLKLRVIKHQSTHRCPIIERQPNNTHIPHPHSYIARGEGKYFVSTRTAITFATSKKQIFLVDNKNPDSSPSITRMGPRVAEITGYAWPSETLKHK